MIRIFLCKKATTQQKGMTLIELLLVIAIIGILAAITYPSYQQYILKSHRNAVMSDMMKVQLALEQSYTQNGSYDYTLVNNSTGKCQLNLGCSNNIERYALTINTGGTGVNIYEIKATPQAKFRQNEDKCGTLILNAGSIGTATSNGVNISDCW